MSNFIAKRLQFGMSLALLSTLGNSIALAVKKPYAKKDEELEVVRYLEQITISSCTSLVALAVYNFARVL